MAEKKSITVVASDGEKMPMALSNDTEFSALLQSLQAVNLKNETNGEYIFGFQSLEHGQTYTAGKRNVGYADQPLATPPDKVIRGVPEEALQGLPPSPPRNGVRLANVQLDRIELVNKIRKRANPIIIIRSPPATGKTSLLDLTEMALTSNTSGFKNRVTRLDLNGRDDQNPMTLLEKKLGASLTIEEIRSLITDDHHLWILIDDAQLAFKAESFWKVVMKDFEVVGSRNIHVVIAATYDLSSQGTTPYSFGEYPHILDLKLLRQEAEALYDGYVSNIFFAKGWMGFKDTLLRLADGHVGVLSGGISMLHRIYADTNKRLSESQALDALRDHRFRVNLNRCFPCRTLMNDDQRKAVGKTIIDGQSEGCYVNGAQGSIDDPALVNLVRAGVLSSEGTFTCLVAQWQYFNQFYKRPAHGPATIEELVVQAVESMSALRLRQSCDNGNFPKEAAFQHLFNEAFTMLLPPGVAVCPELNTFAEDTNGKTVTGQLDFFIAGDLRWAIELLRNGDKINEHVQRFDPTNGKYRSVGHTAHLIVDCRGPRASKQVQSMHERCTLYFSTDFESVEIKMRETALLKKQLMD